MTTSGTTHPIANAISNASVSTIRSTATGPAPITTASASWPSSVTSAPRHPLYGHWPCPDHDRISVLTFFRHVGAPPFSPRQRAIVHTVTTESPWLHADRLPDQPPADLTQLAPRLRTTLLLLLEGLSEKQIARRLHLSPHTVHDYIKAIYRHFDVNNRPELFRRFTADTHLLPAPHA